MSGAGRTFFRGGTASVDSVAALVGRTPLVRLRAFEKDLPGVELWAKLESFNPGGSVKDRPALQMIREAQAAGKLGGGRRLIDSTSGNTGIAYSWIGAALGLPITLVMPENVSAARKQITSTFGAELVFSDPMEGSDGAIRHARRMVEAEPDRWFYPDQYSNPGNPRAHELGTAQEIWMQTRGRVTHFVCGLGTTGTAMGTSRGLKTQNPAIEVHAVQPAEPFHGLEGLKHLPSSIIPGIYDDSGLDGTRLVSTDDGWDMSDRLAREEGLFVGHSSGAALVGALEVAREAAAAGREAVVVTLFPDRADRYFEPDRWEWEGR